MAWSTPKEDWTAVDGVAYTDLNAIGANLSYLQANGASFKVGTGTFTDNDTAQTFTDAFCTATSKVEIVVTSGTPAGDWSVEAGAGDFTITSTQTESADIGFTYYITKVGV